MAHTRSNFTVMLLVFGLVIHCKIASAATYTVGDALGWNFNIQSWPNGKQFHAGDILVFKYTNPQHFVVKVNNQNDYDKCNIAGGSRTFRSGNDQIPIENGQNYFICGVPGHCAGGMKMKVTAT